MYNNIRAYINPKGMIGMHVTGRHVWGHAYGHDNISKATHVYKIFIEIWIFQKIMYFSSQKKLKLKLFTNNIISVKNAKVYNNN